VVRIGLSAPTLVTPAVVGGQDVTGTVPAVAR
jgi:hypothetical protein